MPTSLHYWSKKSTMRKQLEEITKLTDADSIFDMLADIYKKQNSLGEFRYALIAHTQSQLEILNDIEMVMK